MNDFMEVEHGFQLLYRSFHPEPETDVEKGLRQIGTAIDSVFADLSRESIEWFDTWHFDLNYKTYVACLSEHDEGDEEIGRLSMWRSYTENEVGVGLVIDPTPLYNLTSSFGAYSSPVHYLNDDELYVIFSKIAHNILDNKEYLARQGRDIVGGFFKQLLRSIAVCTKHRGFKEEREWRILHTENLDPIGSLVREVECVNGVPQVVHKIPLLEPPAVEIPGISIPNLLKQVIIGPTQFPVPVWHALELELHEAGIENVGDLVRYSAIPIRT